jgi:phage/plasmid-like protein (TIGR03299 family)
MSNESAILPVVPVPVFRSIGLDVSKAKTWREASTIAKMDWLMDKVQLVNPITSEPIPSHAIIRTDTNKWLSTVGNNYSIIQNHDTFECVDALLQTGEMRYETAGCFSGGRTAFCLASLKSDFAPVPGDTHKTYLLFADHRDGRAAQIKLTTVRVVCQNTLNMALKGAAVNGAVLRLSHTSQVESKLKAAKTLISGVKGEIEMISEKLGKLAKKQVTLPQFENVMTKLFPGWEKSGQAQNKVGIVAGNFQSNDGGKIKGIDGSAYALLQSVSRYIDHQRSGLRVGEQSLDVKRAESAMFGTGDAFKTMALENICQIMGIQGFETESAVQNILAKVTI